MPATTRRSRDILASLNLPKIDGFTFEAAPDLPEGDWREYSRIIASIFDSDKWTDNGLSRPAARARLQNNIAVFFRCVMFYKNCSTTPEYASLVVDSFLPLPKQLVAWLEKFFSDGRRAYRYRYPHVVANNAARLVDEYIDNPRASVTSQLLRSEQKARMKQLRRQWGGMIQAGRLVELGHVEINSLLTAAGRDGDHREEELENEHEEAEANKATASMPQSPSLSVVCLSDCKSGEDLSDAKSEATAHGLMQKVGELSTSRKRQQEEPPQSAPTKYHLSPGGKRNTPQVPTPKGHPTGLTVSAGADGDDGDDEPVVQSAEVFEKPTKGRKGRNGAKASDKSKSRLDKHRSRLNIHQRRLNKQKRCLSRYDGRLGQYQDDVDQQKKRLRKYKRRLAKLEKDVAGTNGRLSELLNDADKRHNDNTQVVSQLMTSVDTLEAQMRQAEHDQQAGARAVGRLERHVDDLSKGQALHRRAMDGQDEHVEEIDQNLRGLIREHAGNLQSRLSACEATMKLAVAERDVANGRMQRMEGMLQEMLGQGPPHFPVARGVPFPLVHQPAGFVQHHSTGGPSGQFPYGSDMPWPNGLPELR